MKAQAAVLWKVGDPWSVEEVELDDPERGEVRVRLKAAGLCHSDEHLVTGDMHVPLPIVGGHEGAGVVEQVGPGVTSLKPGDHVVLGFMPICGRCRWCSIGRQNLCELGGQLLAALGTGELTPRIRSRGQDLATMCLLGTFCPYVVIPESAALKIDSDVPLDKAALVGCGVTTGWGAAVYGADVRPGDTVVVIGAGGVGVSAIQGARLAGAQRVIAVDPVEFKRQQAYAFGATHVAPDVWQALPLVSDLTSGVLADKAIIAVGGRGCGDLIAPVMALVARGGRAVVATVAPQAQTDVKLDLHELTVLEKELRGCLFGSVNPHVDIPRILQLYRAGRLALDELTTRTYRLEDINQGYEDMREGRTVRGVILFD